MPQLVDRAMMESVFPPEKLERIPAERLPEGIHESVLSVLSEVGLPHLRGDFWFTMDPPVWDAEKYPEGPRRCRELMHFSEYEGVPEGGGDWIVLGDIAYDVVAVDPVSGTVHCLPDEDVPVSLLNGSLDAFAYFLFLLESERPHDADDFGDEPGSEDGSGSEEVARRLRQEMVRADPLPFEGGEPAWSGSADWEAEDAPPLPTWENVLWEIYGPPY